MVAPAAPARLPLTQLLRDIAVYGGGEVLMRATAFITLPIYTRVLATDEFGAWGFLTTAVGLLAAVLSIGGDSAYCRYFFECKSTDERRTLTSTWIGFTLAWSGIACLAIAASSPVIATWFLSHPSYGTAVALSVLSTPLALANTLLGEALRNQFRPVAFTVLNVGGALLLVGSSILFVVVLKKGLTGLALSTLLSLAVLLPIRAWSVREYLGFSFSLPLLRQLLSFGAPLVPVSLAYWIFAVSDRFVLARLASLRELALYTVAAGVTASLGLIQAALSRAWSPHAFQIYERDRDAAARIFGEVLTFILLGFAVTCVTVSAFAHELLAVFATPTYYRAALAVGPLALGYLAYASTQITAAPISVTKQTHYLAKAAWGAALLNLALNLAFVPLWGMLASAWATAVAYLYLTGSFLRIGKRLWPVAYDIRRAVAITVPAIAFTVATPALPNITSITTVLVKVAYVLAFLVCLLAVGAIRFEDWQRLRAYIGASPMKEALRA